MKTEPALAQKELVAILQQAYGLSIERLEFLPTEWTAYCYRVVCADRARYFLKLTAPGGLTPYCASDSAFYLPLTHALHAGGILPHIAYPIPARGDRFLLEHQGYRLILFNYIEGRQVGFGELPGDLLTRLAGLLGVLHRSRFQISLDYVLQEHFALAFETDLLHSLDVLAHIPPAARQGLRDLRDLLLPRQEHILAILRRLENLQAHAIAANKQQVFCHTDLHGGNLMLDDQDNLYILDWEGALLAPPEQDLFFFALREDFWDTFLPTYERQAGRVPLDSAIFGFYYYRRNLEDLADWVVRILRHNTTHAQDVEDIHGIQQDCIAGWPYLEKNILQIETRLAAREKA